MRLIDADELIKAMCDGCDNIHFCKDAPQCDEVKLVAEAPTVKTSLDMLVESLNQPRDIDWYLEHAEMGFWDPVAEAFKALQGVNDVRP